MKMAVAAVWLMYGWSMAAVWLLHGCCMSAVFLFDGVCIYVYIHACTYVDHSRHAIHIGMNMELMYKCSDQSLMKGSDV